MRKITKMSEMWKDFEMVKPFQHEGGRIERLKDVRKIGKSGKRGNKENGGFWNGG